MPRRHKRFLAELRKQGVRLNPPGRPRRKSPNDGDRGPVLLMGMLALHTGELRGGALARAVYKERNGSPTIAEYLRHTDMKASEDSVVRRWARRWNDFASHPAVRDLLNEEMSRSGWGTN